MSLNISNWFFIYYCITDYVCKIYQYLLLIPIFLHHRMNYKTSKIHTHTHNHTTNLSQLNTQTLSLESKEVLPLRMAFGNW